MNSINNGSIFVPKFDFVKDRDMLEWNQGVPSMIE